VNCDKKRIDLFATVANLFASKILYHKLLGLEVIKYGPDEVLLGFDWRPELVGNPAQNILHGGVTSSVLDVAGGLKAIGERIKQIQPASLEELQKQLAGVGTIDLRVDYLRPGRGKRFEATAKIIRAGNKICVCRMQMKNQQGLEIAVGTGTYLVG